MASEHLGPRRVVEEHARGSRLAVATGQRWESRSQCRAGDGFPRCRNAPGTSGPQVERDPSVHSAADPSQCSRDAHLGSGDSTLAARACSGGACRFTSLEPNVTTAIWLAARSPVASSGIGMIGRR